MAKHRRMLLPGMQFMKAWKFQRMAAPGGWLTFKLNFEYGSNSNVPRRFRRREWQQNSWQVVLTMPRKTIRALNKPCVFVSKNTKKRNLLKSSSLQVFMLSEQDTANRIYRMTVVTQSRQLLCLGQSISKVSLAKCGVIPSAATSNYSRLKMKISATYPEEMATIRHQLRKTHTAHFLKSPLRKQMLTLSVFNAKTTKGKSLNAVQIKVRYSIYLCPYMRHCPHCPSVDQYNGLQQLFLCSICLQMTLRRLMSRNAVSAERVQMGESCLMGKRREWRWMFRNTKKERASWAMRQVASGQPDVQSCQRKESNDILYNQIQRDLSESQNKFVFDIKASSIVCFIWQGEYCRLCDSQKGYVIGY